MLIWLFKKAFCDFLYDLIIIILLFMKYFVILYLYEVLFVILLIFYNIFINLRKAIISLNTLNND